MLSGQSLTALDADSHYLACIWLHLILTVSHYLAEFDADSHYLACIWQERWQYNLLL